MRLRLHLCAPVKCCARKVLRPSSPPLRGKKSPHQGKPGCEAVIKISNADATVRYETGCGHVKERQGCKAVIKISNADATVRYETPCGRVKIVQETNKSENK